MVILVSNKLSRFCVFLLLFIDVKILNHNDCYSFKFCLGKEKNKFLKIPDSSSETSIKILIMANTAFIPQSRTDLTVFML